MTTINGSAFNSLRKAAVLGLVAFSLFGVTACSDFAKADRDAQLDKQDYRDALGSKVEPVSAQDEQKERLKSIPALQPYVSSDIEQVKSMPLVSVSVNEGVPLRDVFFELARQASYDIELDPRIEGSVIFTARERPFDKVVARLCDVAGLRYTFEDDVLRVEIDAPFNKIYKIDYLSYIRKNTGSIRNEVGVVSAEGAADTGSGYRSEVTSEADFWGELEANLTQILAAEYGSMRSGVTQASSPFGGAAPAAEEKPAFVINKQAGIVNVYATEKLHGEIDGFMKLLKRSVTSQVLIEAKILEVVLNDSFALGIDWRAVDLFDDRFGLNYFSDNGLNLLNSVLTEEFNPNVNAGIGSINDRPRGASADSSVFAAGYSSNDVQALVRAVSEYGTVRALASPRLTVLNNQSAVLNVATNQVFFEIDIDITRDDGDTDTSIDTTIRNVPEGVLVNVQPSINLDDNTVSLALRPTITRVVNIEQDPSVQFATADAGITGVESGIPELNVQEIDSVIQVRSGQPVVMGGLLQDRVISAQDAVPGLSDVPVLGNAFRQHNDQIQKTELVIFLKATILDTPGQSVHETDKELYRTFSQDRRPLKF